MPVRSRYDKKLAKPRRTVKKATPKENALKKFARFYWENCRVDPLDDKFVSYQKGAQYLADEGRAQLKRFRQDDEFILTPRRKNFKRGK
jgi:hypothetical protein